MDFDIETLTLKELKDLQTRVARAIATFEDRKKKEAIAQLEEKARELGFTFAELAGTPAPRKRTASAAKYANPADASQTWTGRGRKPGWFTDAIAAGKSAASMEL